MARSFGTQLMFEGHADQAMNFYVSLFKDAKIEHVERYGPNEMGAEGSIKRARFSLGTQQLSCIDSPVKHQFTFTPSVSIFVDCDDEAELDSVFAKLGQNGHVLMPVGNYGFSRRFGWVNDRFGVSWQLNLP